ncbi:hypothetical protein [Endozoicomonas sp. 8E]|uniref:hypothetical protein n=1 Tax=Endozoicomonas sp. 8E TaxID=3035692 RepID=UPI0029390FD9|nr:hypothetical protein [Endozoicomonas sp. 8E]WOG27023.1 hypothetical protein P6910_21095 [Endozoicomonas sp. 8E]
MTVLSFFVACQADPWTGRFIIEFELNSGFTNRSFSIKRDQHTLTVNPSDIAEKKDYTQSDSLSEVKRQQTYVFREKKTIIKSISWQWLYATNLMVAYGLTLSTKYAPSSFISYSWLPIEVIVAVGWLLKSYWNPDSSPFYPIARQLISILTQEDQSLAIITMMPGYGHNQQQGRPSGSSDQQAPQTFTHPLVHLTNLVFSNFGDGNQGPQQHQHTLDLNCFIHPCHGLCRFRPSSDSYDSGALNSKESSIGHTEARPGQDSCPHFVNRNCYRCNLMDGVASDGVTMNSAGDGATNTNTSAGKVICNVIVVGKDGQLRQCETACKNVRTLSAHKSGHHTGKKNCNMTLIGEDGRQLPCGKLCKNAHALSSHKSRYHRGQKTCDVNLIGEERQSRPCGKVCINSKALTEHKRRDHSEQKTCEIIVVGKDGQQWPCGKTCKNIQILSIHKSKYHTGQKSCKETVAGKDGKQRPCGKTCINAQALYAHKNNCHSGQQTCDMTLVSEDNQERPCGKVCKNPETMRVHKRSVHTGQQTCAVTVVGKNGQSMLCGLVFKNLHSLSSHKSRIHSGQQSCGMTVVGKDGQPRLCGKVCKNAGALSNHKIKHRKRKPVNVEQDDDLSPQEDKKKK